MTPLPWHCECGRRAILDTGFWALDDGDDCGTDEAVCEGCCMMADDGCTCLPMTGFPIPESTLRWFGLVDALMRAMMERP